MRLPKINLPRKPVYVKLDSSIDFFSLFQTIEKECETCFFLESLERESYHSRFSIIGFEPESVLSAKTGVLIFNDREYEAQNPYHLLREIMPEPILGRDYSGGLIGYISYEAMNLFEPVLNLPTDPRFPLFQFGVYKDGLIRNKVTGEIMYFYFENSRLDLIQKWIKNTADQSSSLKLKAYGYTMSQSQHKEGVLSILEEIRSGNTFQCQLGFKSEFELKGSPIPIYKKLREINPSPHMYCMKFKNVTVIGASPELLFRLANGEMETFPLAGSIRRGKDDEEDILLARQLLNDPKEIAEHNMLVDLHRNDIGRVARFGTVKVRKLMEIKRYSHIQHISSDITGIIKNNEDMFSGFAATFPAGTLSGSPKIESMKIIARTEKRPRGIYGGGIGQFGFNGNCTFAIPIRSFFVCDSYGYAQASGGIVFDSVPENEYDEIKRKLAAVEKALEFFI